MMRVEIMIVISDNSDDGSVHDVVSCLAFGRHINKDSRGYIQLFPVHVPAHCCCTILQVLSKAAMTKENRSWLLYSTRKSGVLGCNLYH